MDIIGLLQAVVIFSGLPVDELAGIAELLEEMTFKAGSTIVREGDWSTSMYIVIEGQVHVKRGGRTFAHLKVGDVFGEMAALNPEPRSASVIAIEDTRVLSLDEKSLLDLFSRHPAVALGVVRNISKRLHVSMSDMVKDHLYIQQVVLVSAAAANVERGIYQPQELDQVSQRTDELGQLSRVFQTMIREVHVREQWLMQEVQLLQIEINESNRQQQVQQLTETEFFHHLQGKASEIRRSRRP